MAPRKRTFENRTYPVGLSKRMLRDVVRFRYRYPSGKDILFPAGTKEFEAIEAATVFNAKHRNPAINMLLDHDQYNKPMSQWIKHVLKRVEHEELNKGVIGTKVWSAFKLDCERLNELIGTVLSKSITLVHVNDYLKLHADGKSNEVYNRKITFLKKVFSYIRDESGMDFNPAENKKRKPKEEKLRQRLTLDEFKRIYEAAPSFLKVAMQLSIQTTHAVNEIGNARYSDCDWHTSPSLENGLLVFGVLKIHRQKVKEKEASRVAIPITQKLKDLITDSKQDGIVSPYIVHALIKRNNGIAAGLKHPTQLTTEYISREFSKVRDSLGIKSEFNKAERPTFHEIRALSIFLYDESGINPQARAAHTDSESTKVYLKNHVQWVEILAAELAI